MADLPVELWHTIFDHLELTDLSSCAFVSKALYCAVNSYRVREVAFTRRVYKWFHLDFSIYQHRVDYSMTSLLSRYSFSLEHLKRLKIGRSSVIESLNVINNFVHLEELDLDLKNYKNQQSRTLSLANLKVLCLFMSEHLPYLELDTPSLAKVFTFSLKKLEFLYPDSIRCIRMQFHCGKLCMFHNLEYLTFTDIYNNLDYLYKYDSKSFNEISLLPLKRLKEIDFYFDYFEYEENNLAKIKKMIASILALDRPDLKVFWYNVQVIDPNLLTEYKEAMETLGSLVAFQLQHFEKLKDKRERFWRYNFNGSMDILPKAGFDLKSEEFTSKFFAGYSFKRIKVAGKVKEEELLIELIARSPHLFCLEFSSSGLDQSFFDRMADTIRLNGIPLAQLHFKKPSNESLNFNFVLEFRHLEWFSTDQPRLPNELISKLFALPLLTDIELASGKFKIGRLSTNRFQLNGKTLSWKELESKLDVEREFERESEREFEREFESSPYRGREREFESSLYRFASKRNLMRISIVLLVCGIKFFAFRNKQ